MRDRGGGRNSGSQCPEEETPNSVGMKEWEKMDDMGGLHIGWWPGTTDM